MTNITPGPELDRAVAEAANPYCTVGMCASSGCIDIPASECDTPATDIDVLAVWKWKGERNWRTLPKFSTHLNAAFEAAERLGLWDHTTADDIMSLTKDDGQWHMQCCKWHKTAPTPALAICAAILKLRKQTGSANRG